MEKRRAITTTARTHSRLSPAEQAAIRSALENLAPNYKTLPPGTEVELGIGNGMALYERAKANPSGFYVGSEVYLNGMDVVLRAQKKHPLPNLRLTDADAREVLKSIPAGRLGRICVLFPDPWPKARHHKRRIVQTEFLDTAAKALMPGGELWVVSDWPDYIFHTISTVYPHKAFNLTQSDLIAAACKVNHDAKAPQTGLGPHLLAAAPAWWVPTKYQGKAAKQGRLPWFLGAVKKA